MQISLTTTKFIPTFVCKMVNVFMTKLSNHFSATRYTIKTMLYPILSRYISNVYNNFIFIISIIVFRCSHNY